MRTSLVVTTAQHSQGQSQARYPGDVDLMGINPERSREGLPHATSLPRRPPLGKNLLGGPGAASTNCVAPEISNEARIWTQVSSLGTTDGSSWTGTYSTPALIIY